MRATINDVVSIKGFFAEYCELKPDRFESLFGETDETDIDAMDMAFADWYGKRLLVERYADIFAKDGASKCVERLAYVCDKVFYESWLSAKNALNAMLDASVDDLGGKIKTVEESVETEDARQNQTNAFDSETASDTDNSNSSGSRTLERTETDSGGNTMSKLNAGKRKLDIIRDNDFLEIVMEDVASRCSLSIY